MSGVAAAVPVVAAAVPAAPAAVSVRTPGLEYLDLSEASKDAQQKHADVLVRLDLERRARAVVAPTDAEQVKARLRELGHPICLFGEDAAARRDRLRLMLAQNQAKPPTPSTAPAAAAAGEGGAGDGSGEPELFYTPGSDALRSARVAIGEYSFARASARLKRQREEGAGAPDDRVAFLYSAVGRLAASGSQLGDDRPLSTCAFSPSSAALATAGWTGNVKIWDSGSCRQTHTLRGHTERVSSVAYNPVGGQLVSGASDGTVHLWAQPEEHDSTTPVLQMPLDKLVGHETRVAKVGWHPSGQFVGTACYDRSWRLWDATTCQQLLLQEGHSREVHALAFQCDGSLVATGDLGGVGRMWDIRSGKAIMALKGHIKQLISLSFSPNGYTLATGSDDNTSNIWDLRQRKIVYTILAHSALVSQVMFSPVTGEYLVTSSFDGTVRYWSTRDWSPLFCLQAHESKVTAFDISSDETQVATCCFDKTFKVFQPDLGT